MMNYKELFGVLCLGMLPFLVNAQPKLAALFTDNLVLQQQSTVQVWGWDKPTAVLTLTNDWDKKPYKVIADADGNYIEHRLDTNGGRW
ncbi:hypothetical protein [uncultured Mucilaginibacter sp.]|uniref:hypothetical protein n=1 Tax=uncultured Mucilaginibacter sp. TaxID=797541 RepID=UPI0025D12DC2|nr:hypothetical protein [uncultured Mucilaginibacter sp.]